MLILTLLTLDHKIYSLILQGSSFIYLNAVKAVKAGDGYDNPSTFLQKPKPFSNFLTTCLPLINHTWLLTWINVSARPLRTAFLCSSIMISSETLYRLVIELVISAHVQAFTLVLDNSNVSLAFSNLSWFTVTYVYKYLNHSFLLSSMKHMSFNLFSESLMPLHFLMNFRTNDSFLSKPLKVLKRLTATNLSNINSGFPFLFLTSLIITDFFFL